MIEGLELYCCTINIRAKHPQRIEPGIELYRVLETDFLGLTRDVGLSRWS